MVTGNLPSDNTVYLPSFTSGHVPYRICFHPILWTVESIVYRIVGEGWK